MRGYCLLFVVVALALGGCGTPAARIPSQPPRPELSRVYAVQTGMKAAEVRNLLGEPSLIESHEERGGRRTWHFSGGIVIFQDGRVVFRHALPKVREQGSNSSAVGTRPVTAP
jgi:hypothetical protein